MKENFQPSMEQVFLFEGGYSNDPRDPGGMTNLGVTKRVWEEWVKRPVDEAEMRSLTHADVTPLYKAKYWDAVHGDDLPSGVDYAVFDIAVNMGVERACTLLQEACGVKVDGHLGPVTLADCRAANPLDLIEKISDLRQAFYQRLETFPVFGKGWTRRVNDAENLAKGFAHGSIA